MSKPILLLFAAIILSSCDKGARPDNDFDVSVIDPALKNEHPKIVFDEGHKNHHHLATTYKPFATLLANDGCIVSSSTEAISQKLLSDADVFIIATAMGKKDPGDKSPFTKEEVAALDQWVSNGGSLLLVTEHYPFGLAMSPILEQFGVVVHNGYTEDTLLNNKEVMDALLFTKTKGNLNPNSPILNGIERLNTFTGSAVKADSTWTKLLAFTPNAQNYNVKVDVKRDGGDITTSVQYADFYSAKGYSQAICKEYSKGRIVILAESAFITAQYDKNGNRYGMNSPNEDNKRFVLNMIRWLVG